MKKTLVLTVNGEQHELLVPADATLLRVLRDELGLQGTKRGCDTSACGCCTVHVDGKSVYSCAVYALSVDGSEVTTIEGLAHNDELHPLQQAFLEEAALQ